MIGSPSRHASEGHPQASLYGFALRVSLDIEEAIEGYLKAERIELTRLKP
jgi:hypothetical protein